MQDRQELFLVLIANCAFGVPLCLYRLRAPESSVLEEQFFQFDHLDSLAKLQGGSVVEYVSGPKLDSFCT